jgi:hypothetical protein
VIVQRGAAVAAECARVLTSHADALDKEFEGKHYPVPKGVMPR